MSDAELVNRARAGDRGALRDLVERHYDSCWRYAYRMLGNRADAEDAAQETFLRVIAKLGDYKERAQFRQWLFTILVNQCRNSLVARNRRERRFIPTDDLQPSHPPVPNSFQPELADDELSAAMAKLPHDQREALLLRYGEGMDYAQMSQASGATQSALRMRVKRGIAQLRTALQETQR